MEPNLSDAAKWAHRETLKEHQQQDALQVLKQGWRSVQDDLTKAYLRLQLRSYLTIIGLLKSHSPKELSEFISNVFVPPATPEEAKIQLLADIVIDWAYPDNKIEPIIGEALSEINKAYDVIKLHAGGWSSYDSNLEKRRTAVLEWYRHNEARLSYLKEIYLDDLALYEDRGGQERRNFVTLLLRKIVKDKANMELTFREVNAHLKNIEKSKRPLTLEDL